MAEPTDTAPIPLNRAQLQAVKDWAATDRYWASRGATEINLCTFARVILKHQTFDDPPNEIVNAITAVVREADRDFERVGGSSRHWTRDCFLPTLEKAGLVVAPADLLAQRDALRGALLTAASALEQAERFCPCGARPESPRTHPHVSGCEIDSGLRAARAALAQTEGGKTDG